MKHSPPLRTSTSTTRSIPGVKDKETEDFDLGCRDFIAMSPFVLAGTVNTEGDLDVSRAGPTGFVKVLDEYRLAIPDLNGNNRLRFDHQHHR